jgi:outer membrane receptor for ferric coprogen and ferric-rhodotorulic acid
MQHHKDESLEQMVTKTNRYSDIEAQQFYDGSMAPVTGLTLMRKWWMETLRRGIFKKGLLDPKIGLIQSMYQGFSVYISYAKLYEKQRSSK